MKIKLFSRNAPLLRFVAFSSALALGCAGADDNGGRGTATGGASNATGGAGSGGTAGAAPSSIGGASGGRPPATGGAASGGTDEQAGRGGDTAGSTSSGGSLASGGSAGANSAGGKTGGTAGAGSGGAAGASSGGAAGASSGGAAGGGSVDPTKKVTVWLAGDSTMQPCSSACPCGWGSQFQPLLNTNATVVNSARGGRSIQSWLLDFSSSNVTTTMVNGECVPSPKNYTGEWKKMLDASTGMKAGDYLLIEFGINDGDATCERHVGKELFKTLLGEMAAAAKQRGAQPIYLTSTSAITCTGSTQSPNRGFVAETKAAGAANDVPVIDLTALSAALYTSLGLCPDAGTYTSTTSAVGKFFCQDHTHFEAAGASQIAGVVAKALKDQKIGLGAYVK